MAKKLLAFSILLFAVWLLASMLAFWIAGWRGVYGSAAAATVCGVPGLATLALYHWSCQKRSDRWRIAGILGGTLVRMVVVMGAGAILHATLEGFDLLGFLIWLMLFYLASLTAEVLLLIRGEKSSADQRPVRG